MKINEILLIAAMFGLPLLAVWLPLKIGQHYGIKRREKWKEQEQVSIGSVVASVFGLLAFMLAFTFQIASERYNQRKALLLEEVTNIRTTYLRAGLLSEPFRSHIRTMMKEYVDLRIDVSNDRSKLSHAMKRSQQILDSSWGYAEQLANQDRSSEVYALFTESINDLVSVFNHRISMTLEYRIPPIVLWILFVILFSSMLVLGYQFGLSGKIRWRLNTLLSFIFALVMFLILVLDHPESGLAPMNQKPMLTLQQQLSQMQIQTGH